MNESTDYFNKHKNIFLKDLFQLLKIKSITKSRKNCKLVVDWLIEYIKDFFDTKIVDTLGNPIVLAKLRHFDNEKPSILFYGHYILNLLNYWINGLATLLNLLFVKIEFLLGELVIIMVNFFPISSLLHLKNRFLQKPSQYIFFI